MSADLPTAGGGSLEAFAALLAGHVVAAQRAQRVVTHAEAGKLVEDWIASRMSVHTRRAYRAALESLAEWLHAPSLAAALSGLLSGGRGECKNVILRWRAEQHAAGAAPGSINLRIATLRSLLMYAADAELVTWPAPKIPGFEWQHVRDTRGPGRKGVAAMLKVLATRSGPKMIRDVALVRLMFDLALRVGEVCSLDVEHVRLADPSVNVLGKGRFVREALALPEPTRAAVAAWVALRGDAEGPLFVSRSNNSPDGTRLTTRNVHRIIRDLGRVAGLGRVTPHGLRHAAITAALEATRGDVTRVAQFSRHKKIQTLSIYDDRRRADAAAVANMVALP